MKIIDRTIESRNLILLPCNQAIINLILKGGNEIGEFLEIGMEDLWTEPELDPFRFSIEKIKNNPEEFIWWTWLIIHKEDKQLIGNAGYKGPPDPEGMIEIGYTIAPNYRGKGFATEAAMDLIENAIQFPEVNFIRAHTLAEENASCAVLRKCGFTCLNETAGMIWRWERKI